MAWRSTRTRRKTLISTQVVGDAAAPWTQPEVERDALALTYTSGTVWKSNLLRVRPESPCRPPRHRRDACSMAWQCRFLTARRSQRGHVIAEK